MCNRSSEYELLIGLEVHLAVDTTSKAFALTNNNNISWNSIGYLGTLPNINPNFIRKGVLLAHWLNMKVEKVVKFDRKNYFYHDLPKGYQITQHFFPLGTEGHLQVGNHTAYLQELHLEEDTAKQNKEGDLMRLELNRLGSPLIEIVTKPCFNSADQVISFLKELRKISLQGISKARAEKGEFRVDVNISITHNQIRGNKTEVKNLNSLNHISLAIDYEHRRQIALLKNNQTNESNSCLWDGHKTVVMRKKNDFYFYIPEANIPPIHISENDFQSITSKKLITNHIENCDGLSDKEKNHLLDKHLIPMYSFFVDGLIEPKQSYYWTSLLSKYNPDTDTLKRVLDILRQDTNHTEKKVFIQQILGGQEPTVSSRSPTISMEERIKELFDNRKTNDMRRVEKYISGIIMKESLGKADIQQIKQILKSLY